MYKRKYYKYKKKYLQYENSFDDPDVVDADDEDNPEVVPDDQLELVIESSDLLEVLNDEDKKTLEFNGVFDIGKLGLMRGMSFAISDFDPRQFTKKLTHKKRTKILNIDSIDLFDQFTDKFGNINPKNGLLYIEWGKVGEKYKGIYVQSSALGEYRDSEVPFRGETVTSWVNTDFNHLDQVIIFKHPIDIVQYQRVTKPFKGYAMESEGVKPSEFVRIYDEKKEGILIIDDIKGFDKFTSKYGRLKKNSDKQTVIDIDWQKVSRDYEGICVDSGDDLRNNRFSKAFYKGVVYNSWWKEGELDDRIVYFF